MHDPIMKTCDTPLKAYRIVSTKSLFFLIHMPKHTCPDCGQGIKLNQKKCSNCWIELIWKNKDDMKDNKKSPFIVFLKTQFLLRIKRFIGIVIGLLIIVTLIKVIYDLINSVVVDITPFLWVLWPILIIWVFLLILYLLVRFIKRSRRW